VKAISSLAPRPLARPAFSTIKALQQAAWSSGNYAVIGRTLHEILREKPDLKSGERVLDVATGKGKATLAGARP
jgi:ubiquinone/menaquinone biosynthesis C-methylase UbiE